MQAFWPFKPPSLASAFLLVLWVFVGVGWLHLGITVYHGFLLPEAARAAKRHGPARRGAHSRR